MVVLFIVARRAEHKHQHRRSYEVSSCPLAPSALFDPFFVPFDPFPVFTSFVGLESCSIIAQQTRRWPAARLTRHKMLGGCVHRKILKHHQRAEQGSPARNNDDCAHEDKRKVTKLP